MRRFSALIQLLVLFTFYFQFVPTKAYAGELTPAFVKLERQKASTATGGTVCAQTPASDNGTETSVQVVFPTSFTVNSTASNWTVTTTDLPSGGIAWPGIGTATAVSGQIVTFPSTNLSTSTLYCFNFSGTSTLTTGSVGNDLEGTIRTRAAGSTTIDSIVYGLSIVSNDQISVTATVPAQPTDYQALIELTSPANTTFPQNTTLDYTLTYGTTLNYPTNITVEASWSLGTIQGSGSPTVAILDYVVGSASNGYNSTPPVVDITNRTISWTISAFPGSTSDQTVTFQLKTNASYTGNLPVDFTVSGRVQGPGTVTPDSDVTSTYQYNFGATPTPTVRQNVSGPGDGRSDGRSDGMSDGRSDNATSSSLTGLKINTIEVRSISSSQAAIFVSTNQNTAINLTYGTDLKKIDKKVTSQSPSTQHLLVLDKLLPDTSYFFKVNATSKGKSVSSEFFSFRTAKSSTPPSIKSDSVLIYSGDLILLDAYRGTTQPTSTINTVIIPKNTPYSFKFLVGDSEQIKSIEAIIRDDKVLGINNTSDFVPSSDTVSIAEIKSGQYFGRLNSKNTTGTYKLIMKVRDFYGNVTEQPIAHLIVTEPMRIVRSDTKKGVENAKITIYFYNPRLKIYELLSPSVLAIKNPNFSEPDGSVPLVLPQGQYRADIEAIGYENKSVQFTIGTGANETYPFVELKKLPFKISFLFQKYSQTVCDVLHSSQLFVHNLRTSIRFFELIAVTVLFAFVFVTLLASSSRFSIPFFLLGWYALYHLMVLFKRIEYKDIIQGKVIDEQTQKSIKHVMIYVTSATGKIFAHTSTNQFGEFYSKAPLHSAKISLSKKGFKNLSKSITEGEIRKSISLQMTALTKPKTHIFATIHWYIRFIIGSLFEGLMIITLLLEVLLGMEFGLLKVAPFVVVSILNLVLWAGYIRSKKSFT